MLQEIFGVEKPIIGMLHLKKIPKCKAASREFEYALKKAQEDIWALQEGGIDGICIENWEVESTRPFLEIDEARGLERLVEAIRGNITVPAGINVLHNDYRLAFPIASRFGLKFVCLDVFVDRVRSNFEYSDAPPFDVVVDIKDVRKWKSITGGIPLFVQVHPKHYKPIDKSGKEITEKVRPSIEYQAKEAICEGADAIVIAKATGVAPNAETIRKVKDAIGHSPALAGSGVTPENISTFFPVVDGVIVGTSLKTKDFDHVVKSKVECLMENVRKIRGG